MVGVFPPSELGIQGYSELVLAREVAVVGNLPASDPPYPFDGIQLGRIGRQEDTHQAVLVLGEEVFQVSRPVPRSVVQNEVDPTAGALQEMTKEIAKGVAVECGGLSGEKSASFQVQRPEVADFLAGGGGEHARLLSSGCPHLYEAAVSLEMHFVFAPELNIGIAHPLIEVFLKASCWRGSASRAWRRGLCRVNPSLWNSLWHCRTPRETA